MKALRRTARLPLTAATLLSASLLASCGDTPEPPGGLPVVTAFVGEYAFYDFDYENTRSHTINYYDVAFERSKNEYVIQLGSYDPLKDSANRGAHYQAVENLLFGLSMVARTEDAPTGRLSPQQKLTLSDRAYCREAGERVIESTNTLIYASYTSPWVAALEPAPTVKWKLKCVPRGPAPDTTPDPFSFTAQQDIAPDTKVQSNPITVSGIDNITTVEFTNGQLYKYDPSTQKYELYWGGLVKKGEQLVVGVTASATPGETITATVDIGGVKADFKVTTRAAAPTEDSTPDAFDFPDRSDLTPDETYTSPAIKVSGINIPVTASAEGGLLSVNDGPHQPTATVKTGDSIKVVTQTPSTFAATKTVTVKIGTVSDTFTLTTLPADTTPDLFSFTDQKDVKQGSTVTSDEVTVTGINAPAPIAVTGGTLLINGQTSTQTTVKAGDKVVVQVTASSSPSTSVSATVTIGGKSAIFTVTTKAAPPADTTPDPFSFTDQKDVAPGSTVTSNEVTVTGINAPAPIAVTGGTLLINGQTSTQTTVRAGDKVAVKLTSAATLSTPVSATVTIGGQSATFTVTTMPRVSEVADLNPYGPPWLMDLAIDHQSNLYK